MLLNIESYFFLMSGIITVQTVKNLVQGPEIPNDVVNRTEYNY